MGSADDVAAATAPRALGLTDEIAAAEVAVSTRWKRRSGAREAADAGFARDVESAAARALALGARTPRRKPRDAGSVQSRGGFRARAARRGVHEYRGGGGARR